MTPTQRLFDLSLACLLSLILLPVIGVLIVVVLLLQGRPVFYIAQRMKTPTQSFGLIKFRTMQIAPSDHGVSGGDKQNRITKLGRVLRRTRLDELPQLWNVFKGDISFIGPRPPLRQYVDQFPDLYAQVLRQRPGITGLATVVYHRHEAMLLARCTTPQETDAVYARACIPRKARLDMIYHHKRTICLDIWILYKTIL